VLGPSFPVPDAKNAILVTIKGPAVLTIQTQFFHHFLRRKTFHIIKHILSPLKTNQIKKYNDFFLVPAPLFRPF
jgi:hypothetical protein